MKKNRIQNEKVKCAWDLWLLCCNTAPNLRERIEVGWGMGSCCWCVAFNRKREIEWKEKRGASVKIREKDRGNTGVRRLSFFFNHWGHFSESFHFESLGCFEECGKLVLSHIHFTSVHKLENCLQMSKRYILQDDDGMFRGIFLKWQIKCQLPILYNFANDSYLKQGFKVWAACR